MIGSNKEGVSLLECVQLALSPKTVRHDVSSIFGKVHVANRTQAIVRDRDAGVAYGRFR